MTVETEIENSEIVGTIESQRGVFAVSAANFVGVGADQLFAGLLALVTPGELAQVCNTLRILSVVAHFSMECQSFA